MNALYFIGLALLALGVVLVTFAARGRDERGLGNGKTLALDDVTIFSKRLGLVGRPDRLVRDGKHVIPEEWKSSRRVNRGHELQLGAYFLLVEEKYGQKPPHGFIVLGDGTRVQVENSEGLRAEVLRIARSIREHRARLDQEIPACRPASMCRACGHRKICSQARP